MATFAWLPEEVLVHIISFLDVDPPSKQRLRLEPTENIFDSNVCPLKHLSTTSRQLRRLTVPVLFKHVRLDFTPDEGSCLQLSALHGCIVRAAKRATGIAEVGPVRLDERLSLPRPSTHTSLEVSQVCQAV